MLSFYRKKIALSMPGPIGFDTKNPYKSSPTLLFSLRRDTVCAVHTSNIVNGREK